jgi:hypothetical protein
MIQKEATLPLNGSLNELENPGITLESDLNELLESVKVDPSSNLEKPPTILEIHSGETVSPCFTLGNFSMIIGKAKSKKTFFITAIIAAVLSCIKILNCLSGCIVPDSKNGVLFFDTEQSDYHLLKTVKRIGALVGTFANFEAFGLRKFKPKTRLALIEHKIYQSNNISLVVIDGIRDLVTSINDEEQATDIISALMRWTSERNIHIIIVLHQNKGDMNARGHLGTEAINKAETTISVRVDSFNKDTSIVECEYSREMPFEPFSFKINENGIPESCELPEGDGQNRKASTPDRISDERHFSVLGQIFKVNPNPKYAELWQAIKVIWAENQITLGDNKAKDYLAYYIHKQWIIKNERNYKYNRAVF